MQNSKKSLALAFYGCATLYYPYKFLPHEKFKHT